MPLIIGLVADYALEELLKVCIRIDAVEPATFRKREDKGRIFGSILTPYILAVLRKRLHDCVL